MVIADLLKTHFPLQNIQDVVELFRSELTRDGEPNLAILSIVLGAIENTLTVNRALPNEAECERTIEPIFPILELSTVEALHEKFVTLIKGSVDLSEFSEKFATRDIVKRISDTVWNTLTRSYYKDKAHIQSLYSYLTGCKLDCFGVALAVVVACQVMGYRDVHLALSEDHAWVIFGEHGQETAEVTWHGKGNEDKRGQPICLGVAEKSWLYLNGHPVKCSRHMEVAAMVSGINPSINATTDSLEMGSLQQELLWLLYDLGHLARYPMSLGNLGDLEEICPSPGRPPPLALFQQAIDVARRHYAGAHVYPHTYLGGYYYRQGLYSQALSCWADATQTIKRYNYTREDEEVYKEFMEINNELLPHICKMAAVGAVDGQRGFLSDPECYVNLLRLFDGICGWEEGSQTPVLHIGWAKNMIFCLSKFEAGVRGKIEVHAEGEEEEDEKDGSDTEIDSKPPSPLPPPPDITIKAPENDGPTPPPHANGGADEEKIRSTIRELASKVSSSESQNDTPNPNIAALAQACGESILNPEFLLGGGDTTSPFANTSETKVDYKEFLSSTSSSSPFPGLTVDTMLQADSPAEMLLIKKSGIFKTESDSPNNNTHSKHHVSVTLTSQKMKGLKDLLKVEGKLNASAIKLQLTAQSQVDLKRSKVNTDWDVSGPRKRTRKSIEHT